MLSFLLFFRSKAEILCCAMVACSHDNCKKDHVLESNINSNIQYMSNLQFEWNPIKFKIHGIIIWCTNDIKSCAQLIFDTKFQEVNGLFMI